MILSPTRGKRSPLGLLLLGTVLLSGLPSFAGHGVSSYWDGMATGEYFLNAGRWSEALATFQRLAQVYPGSYDPELGLGRALLGARRWGEAVAPLEAAVLLRPDLPRPRVLLGRAYSRQGQYDRAEDPLLAAYNLDPSYEPAWGELAGVYLATARPALAEPLLALLVARHPRDAVLLGKQLGAARALGRGDLARAALVRLVAALPPAQTPAYRRELALDYLSANLLAPRNLPAAEAQARAALRLEPGNPDNAVVLAQALLAQGKGAQAAGVLRGVPAERVRQPELCVGLAQAELAAGQPEAALAQARRALELAPNSEAAARVGRAAAQRAGLPAEALRYARRLVALHPADPAERAGLAESLEAAGQPAEALVQWELAAAAGGSGRAALEALAQRAAALGNPQYQLTVARRLAAVTPDTGTGPLVDLLLDQGRWGEAAARLGEWERRAPEDPQPAARRARLLRETGRAEEAGKLLAEALRRAPRSPALRLERALLAARQGDPAAEGELREIIRDSAEGSPASAAALMALEGLYDLVPRAGTAALGALADAQPGRADLALAAAAQCARAGRPGQAAAYYERAGRAGEGGAREALGRAAAAYEWAGETAGLLRVAGSFLLQVAHDPQGLALVTELQTGAQAPAAPVRAALVRLLQAEPGTAEYQRCRLALFSACGRQEPLEAALTARAAASHAPADQLGLALAQEQRDPEAALGTLGALPAAEAEQPAAALERARLLRQTGRPAAALAARERVVSGDEAEVARERGDLLAQEQRPGEALGEYLRALRAGAAPGETLGKVAELWRGQQVSLAAVLAGLDGVCAAAADPAPLRQWVQETLPAGDPAVRAWLEFHGP